VSERRLAAMRRDYVSAGLDESDLAATWLAQFQRWLADAVGGGMPEPNAMTLATADASGRPSARTVLLKGVDERGFLLFTNLRSRKGREAQANPRAALVFPWLELQRQIVVDGSIEQAGAEESDAYFAARPRGAQIGALASPQSDVIPARDVLERSRARIEARHPQAVPRPAHWGGLRVVPDAVEFWQGRPDRLHDRLRFRRAGGGEWLVERLAP
jgi:pyridoxamine 5'-phosphate oxidase